MRKTSFTICLLLLAFTFSMTSCETEHAKQHERKHENHKKNWDQEDHKNVKAAIENYVEGLYQVDSTRIVKSVDTTLRKLGYWYNPKDKAYMDNLPMTYNQLVRLSARWNKDGSRVNENSPKKIEIYDIDSKTASAKLTAEWGIDYFHLGKVNGEWKIFNIIWQSMPEIEE